MSGLETRRKSGFFARLSNIIIIEGLFIFAALALILFYPPDSGSIESNIHKIQDKVSDIRDYIVRLDIQELRKERSRGLDGALTEEPALQFMGLYDIDSAEHIENIYTYRKVRGSVPESQLNREIQTLMSPGFIRAAMETNESRLFYNIYNDRHLVLLNRFTVQNSRPIVMVTVMDHDLLISSRSNLLYVLFILFLCSTLISLLTVYLISKRFRQPLSRLMRGLDKTAQGELYYMIETNGDDEINNLSLAFNSMTQSLWENQKNLKTFNARLKKANLSLIESQMFLATLIESSPLCIIVASHTNQIMIFNRKASSVFGYESEEVIGRNADSLFKRSLSEDKLEQRIDGRQPGFEMICQKKDGESFPAYIIVSPVKIGRGDVSVYLYIIKDISESKNFQDMMVRLDRYYTRGQMAGDIAHEINNYLAILSGNIELMPLILKKNDLEKIYKKLEVMKGTVDKIACFADGLMDVPQDKVNFEQVDLNQLVENVLAFLKPQNKFDNIIFDLQLSAEIPLVELDPGQVQQLLVNYIFNAADAVKNNEGEKKIVIITSSVTVDGEKYTRVEVGDNGPGIPEEKQEVLFKKRFTTKRKGHGIGLVTCRKIAEAHTGRVGYHKTDLALFYFDIPMVRKPAVSGHEPAAKAEISPA
ncbi:MAG: PAS domain S-box protein [candidate division Zixibacteria bacterium]|nr:PAS domain S-box protein [candidate division Zixibacteria bacterium]